jgi:type IVB pilus formation R64 PilN family outer membrane protein
MTPYRKLSVVTILFSCIGLVACVATPALYKESQQKIEKDQRALEHGESRFGKRLHGHSAISAQSITLDRRVPQPAWMSRQIAIQGNNLPLEFMVSKILANTGATAMYDPAVNKSMPVTLNYSGTIAGALEALASKSHYGYEASGNRLMWSAFISRTFDVSFMPGASQYLLGGTKQQAGGSSTEITNLVAGQSNDQYSSLQAALSIWEDLKKALDQLKSKEGSVMVSEATTTITVRDHPENVRAIGEYLAHMDRTLSRQVALDVQVLEITLNKGFNYGINWNMIRDFSAGKLSIGGGANPSASGTGGGAQVVTLSPLGSAPTNGLGLGFTGGNNVWGGTQVFINALSQQGQVSIATQPRVVTLNNQVAEIGINNKTSYLARVTTTVTQGSGSSSTSLTPGLITTGFSLYLLPKIQGNDVYLHISSTLSNGLKIGQFSSSGSASGQSTGNSATIQLPSVSEKRFNQRAVVPSGATLVIAGFKQMNTEANKNAMFGADPLGGRGAQQNNTETIVLITPTIVRSDR